MAERSALRRAFLESQGLDAAKATPLAGDASFRSYYRIADTKSRFVLMDAPPGREDVGPFVALAAHLQGLGYSAPEVFAVDGEKGFVLLEDLGDTTYTNLFANGEEEEPLYRLAVDLLIDLHRRPLREAVPDALPSYTEERFLEEAMLLTDWYLPAVTGQAVPPPARAAYAALWPPLLKLAGAVPETLVLRDYHVDNLLFLAKREGVAACGLLDFQDALRGPVSYDLVSLLEDARRDLDPRLVAAVKARYLAAFPALDGATFARSYAILGAQRNCKIIGIFTRLFRRDGKAHYLSHLPRVWRLLEENVRAPSLAPLQGWLAAHVPPPLRKIPEAEAK